MRALAIVLLLFGAACAHRGAPTTAPEPSARVTTTPRVAAPVTPPRAEPEPVATAPVEPAPAVAPPEPSEPTPLSDDQRAIFFGTLSDEAPEDRESVAGIDNEKHYVAGNEQRLDAFASTIANKGGGYLGVGSDQAYLFIGWARPELAWLVDYDPMVVDVHMVYRAFLRNAETPEDFLALWDQAAKEQALAAIRNEPGAGKRHVRAYGRNRGWILRRLKMVTATMRAQATPSFLTDQEQYAFVRELVLADRVRALVADLKGDGAIQSIGEAAKSLAVPIRVLYLSNAEGYWSRYRAKFRKNIAALPFDEQSVVLRTLLIWHVNADYRYNVQPALNYVQWLARPFISTVYDIVHDRPDPSKRELNFFVTEGDPDASPAARRAAEEQSKR